MGEIITCHQPLGTGRGLGLWSRPEGGGEGVQMMEACRGRKGTSDGRTLGSDRDLGVGRGWQRGSNQTREVSHRIAQGNPWAAQHGREEQTSGGGQRVGAQPRWTVAPRRGEMGGGRSRRKEREKRR